MMKDAIFVADSLDLVQTTTASSASRKLPISPRRPLSSAFAPSRAQRVGSAA